MEAGAFDAELLARVRAMQQPIQEIPPETAGGWRGYWVGIHIDPETGIRRGAVSPYLDGGTLWQHDRRRFAFPRVNAAGSSAEPSLVQAARVPA